MGIDGQDSVSRRFAPLRMCKVFHRLNEKDTVLIVKREF
jgi:hypothetical protein